MGWSAKYEQTNPSHKNTVPAFFGEESKSFSSSAQGSNPPSSSPDFHWKSKSPIHPGQIKPPELKLAFVLLSMEASVGVGDSRRNSDCSPIGKAWKSGDGRMNVQIYNSFFAG
jgi:hypothetical protein